MKKLHTPFQIFLALVLTFSLLTPAVTMASPTSPRMSASLTQMVAVDPGGIFRMHRSES